MRLHGILRALGATAAASLLMVASAPAALAQTTVLKMAHVYTPGNIWYETAEAYAKAVEEKSGGKVKIQIAHSGSTGDWPSSIEGLKIGTNDIVLQSIGTLDRYNILPGIEAWPYLLRDVDHFKKVYYGPVGAEFMEEVAKKTSFRIIGAGYRGARWLTSNKPVANLADLQGLKMRVPPLKMYRMTWDLLGASTVPMGPAELFTSLQQGVVDGQENPLEYVQFSKFYEVQKYGIDTRHVIGAMTWIFSDARFKRLPADVQALLKEEGERVMLEATERMIGLEGEIQKQLASEGMKFNEVDRAAFAAKLEPMGKEFPELAPWVAKFRAVN
ncbi:MAG TPA: TRAP transporter substrate-binding protein [Burkholderiaceae bacterium]|nr:TRAP transporter substrate-binding protein [Burkholderiaceae bacterium]